MKKKRIANALHDLQIEMAGVNEILKGMQLEISYLRQQDKEFRNFVKITEAKNEKEAR